MIPKKIHQVWVGDKPIPDLYLQYTKEWQRLNPKFEYKLWTSNDFDENEFSKYCYKNNRMAHYVDYLRAQILYNEGGVYVDVDIKPIRPIPYFWLNAEFTIVKTDLWWVMGGFLMANKELPFLKSVIKDYNSFEYTNKEVYTNFRNDWDDGSVYIRNLLLIYKLEFIKHDTLGIRTLSPKLNLLDNTIMLLPMLETEEKQLKTWPYKKIDLSKVIALQRPEEYDT